MNRIIFFCFAILTFANFSYAEEKIDVQKNQNAHANNDELDSVLELKEEVLSSVPVEELGTKEEHKKTGSIFDLLFGFENNALNGNSNSDDDSKPTHILIEQFGEGKFYQRALIQIIDRTIGKVYNFSLAIGELKVFNDLEIKAMSCWQPNKKVLIPQSRGMFAISSKLPNDADNSNKLKEIFKGWLIASNPAASYVKHPKFDIALRTCENEKVAAVVVEEAK